jgi:DNA-binding transcriptional LysR family regulator
MISAMNLVHLRAFLAVYRHASYTRAAEELLLTQPAVSRQIDQLERDLGVALFEQVGKKPRLTAAGESLVKEAEKLLADVARAVEAVSAHRSADRGRIAVGASSTPGLYLLPPVVGKFCQAFPNVEFHYTVETSRAVEQKVLHNQLDVGFVGVAPSSNSITATKLLEDEIRFFAWRSHPLASRRDIDLKSLVKSTWVIREKGAATRELVESRLNRQKLKPAHVIEMSCPEGVKSLIAAGVGISYMSIHGLSDDLKRGRFKTLDVRGFDVRRELYLIRHRDKHLSPVIKEFERLARAALELPRRATPERR